MKADALRHCQRDGTAFPAEELPARAARAALSEDALRLLRAMCARGLNEEPGENERGDT